MTRPIKELASQIGESPQFTCNLVSVWQTENNTVSMPTADQLKSRNKERDKEIEFAVPVYTYSSYDSSKPFITRDINTGEIHLYQFQNNTIPESFWEMFKDIPELKSIINNNTTMAYAFLLWREMAIVRLGGWTTSGYLKMANKEALNKLKSFLHWKGITPESTALKLKVDPKEFTLYSGGAQGADQFWGYSLRRLGVQVIDLRPKDYDELSQEKKDIIERSYQRVATQLGRAIMGATSIGGKLIRRDFLQVENADSVLAIGTINTRNTVDGGTGYAVQWGINKGIPVYVYDLGRHEWRYWHPQSRSWRSTEVPPISRRAAVVGTRGPLIDGRRVFPEEGKRAITQAVENTFLPQSDTQVQPMQQSVQLQVKDNQFVTVSPPDDSLTKEQRNTLQQIRAYYQWQRQHITKSRNFKKDHTYFYDGKKIDYSITGLREVIYPSNVSGDHSYATAIGNAVDAVVRDYFEGKVDPRTQTYTNLSRERRDAIIADCGRLGEELNKRWPNCKIITTEFTLGGKVTLNDKEVTVAGTMDMLVIDKQGNLHILDMKTKGEVDDKQLGVRRPQTIEDWENRRDYTFQLNGYRQLIEAIMPDLANKISSLDLIWFDQSYPKQGREATYTTSESTEAVSVTTTTQSNIPLESFSGWTTPHLKENISESLVSLRLDDSLESPKSLDENWAAPTTRTIMQQKPIQAPAGAVLATDSNGMPKVGRQHFDIEEGDPRINLTRSFTSQQRKYRTEMMAKDFSTLLNRAVEKERKQINDELYAEIQSSDPITENIARLTNEAKVYSDEVTAKRAYINTYGLTGILDEMKSMYEEIANMDDAKAKSEYGANADYVRDAYSKVLDNFMPLMQEVAVELEKSEPIRFVFKAQQYNDGTGVEQKDGGYIEESIDETSNEDNQFGDDDEGKRATGNDGWSFKARFVEPHATLTKAVKALLRSLKRTDTNGRVIKDDLGNVRYVSERYAYASLLAELASKVITVEDFVVKNEDGSYNYPALEALQDIPQYTWVKQVLKAFKKDPRLASQFFRNFRRDAVSYWSQRYNPETSKFETFPLNQLTSQDSAMISLTRNYSNLLPQHIRSIFDNSGNLDSENAKEGVDIIDSILPKLTYLDATKIPEITKEIGEVLQMIGFTPDSFSVEKVLGSVKEGLKENGVENTKVLLQAAKKVLSTIATKKYKGKPLPDDINMVNYFSTGDFANQGLKTIADLAGVVSETDNVQMFRIGDADYPTYAAPDYSTKLFRILTNDDRRKEYIDTHFKPDSWFYRNGEWSSEWIRIFESDSDEAADIRAHMTLIDVPYLGTAVDRNVKEGLYENWSPYDIKTAFIRQYFAHGYNPGSKVQYGYYNFPIFSDTTMARFIRFVRYTGNPSEGITMEDQLKPLFRNLVLQELHRIKRIRDRRDAGATPISNYDKTGEKFFFLPMLNDDSTFLEICQDLNDAKEIDELNKFIDDTLWGTETSKGILREEFEGFLDNITGEERSVLIKDLVEEGAISSGEELDNALWEYFLNHHYATSQIIELTTTDLAFYKDDNGIDFQKRFKEVFAAGDKLNTESKYGKKIERSVILKDQIVTSSAYTGIKFALDKAVKEGRLQNRDRDAILFKFRDINVTDGQAFRSLKSMRSILDMKGEWTDEMENAFERFQAGQWDMSDFNLVWQTIKPYVFTNVLTPDGLGGMMNKPVQHKDSEFLLLAMYQLVAASTDKSGKIKALNEFMDAEDIDVVLFESAVKVGGQGPIDLNYDSEKLDIWIETHADKYKEILEASGLDESESPIKIFKEGNDKLLHEGKIDQRIYNMRMNAIELDHGGTMAILTSSIRDTDGKIRPDVVHEIPYEDYCIQQPTPEHLFDVTDAVYGSQFRNLIISDLPDDFSIVIQGKTLNKQQVLDLYQALIVENLLDSFEKVEKDFVSIETLQEYLITQVTGNPKYGRDMLDALEIVEITNPLTGKKQKVFNIPLQCPTLTAKVQELILSRFKNAITKQTINGGNAILVSNFGFTKELKVQHDSNTGAVTGIECYLPAYSKKFFADYLVERVDNKGNKYQELDFERIEREHPELLRGIGYRIPTEDKYSMVPLIIKGFLPQQNGSSIMLPADITTLSGSDFDIDKLFLMLPSFKRIAYDMKAARDAFKAENDQFKAAMPSRAEELTEDDPREFQEWFEVHKEQFKLSKPRLVKNKYDIDKLPQEQGKDGKLKRDNMLIDLSFAILTHPSTADKLQNPGNFDDVKTAARTATILEDPRYIDSYIDRLNLDVVTNEDGTKIYSEEDISKISKSLLTTGRSDGFKPLDKIVREYAPKRSVLSLDTWIFNHQQNMAGASLIGMYANNNTSQAKHQNIKMSIREATFRINGRAISSLTDPYNKHADYWDRISKNCAKLLAASVDNGKDPNLAALMQNSDTANIMGTMLRAGLTLEEAGLLFSHPVIRNAIRRGCTKSPSAFHENIIKLLQGQFGELHELAPSIEIILNFDFTSEFLTENIIKNKVSYQGEESDSERKSLLVENYRVACLFYKFLEVSDLLGELTRCTRADSPNGAIGISIAEAEIQRRNLEMLRRKALMPDCPIVGLSDIIENGKLSLDMSKDKKRNALLHSRQPMLQGFYSLGIDSALDLAGQHFFQTSDTFQRRVDFIHDNSSRGVLNKRSLNALYLEAVQYYLSSSDMFGGDGNYEAKRTYYLEEFPKEFLKTIRENPDLASLSIVRKLLSKDGQIILDRASKIDRATIEVLMRDFDMMMFDLNNPTAQQLAMDLFAYCYFRDGLTFGPNNFGRFFSSTFMSHIPSFIDTLRDMQFDDSVNWDNFIDQFYLYHGLEVAPRVTKSNKDFDLGEGMISISNLKADNPNVLGAASLEYICYTEYIGAGIPPIIRLYKLVSRGDSRSIYRHVPSVTAKTGKRYDVSRNSDQLAQAYVDEGQRKAAETQERLRRNKEALNAAVQASADRQQQQVIPVSFPNVTNIPANMPSEVPMDIINSADESTLPPEEVLNADGSSVPNIPPDDLIAEIDTIEKAMLDAQQTQDTINQFERQYPSEINELDEPLC